MDARGIADGWVERVAEDAPTLVALTTVSPPAASISDLGLGLVLFAASALVSFIYTHALGDLSA